MLDALKNHFDRSGDAVNVEQICEMTALDENTVKNALRVLKQANRVNGTMVEEFQYPIWVTSINYE